MERMQIKVEDWNEWRQRPETQELLKFLALARQALMEQWAAKQFQGETRDEVLILNSAALGKMEAYQEILELNYEQLKEVLTDEE